MPSEQDYHQFPGSGTNHHEPTVSIDKLTLIRRYPLDQLEAIQDAAVFHIAIGSWYLQLANTAGAAVRLRMFLPDQYGERSDNFADLRFIKSGFGGKACLVRTEWNPGMAGGTANAYVIQELTSFLPDTPEDFFSNAYVSRLDLTVDVPGVRCEELVGERATHHKAVNLYTNAKGEVSELRIGKRQPGGNGGKLIRLYDKDLPYHGGQQGVREIELGRPGYLTALAGIDNPFSSFRIYQIPTALNDGALGHLICAARQRGIKRAMTMLTDKDQIAGFKTIVEQSRAPWWDPAPLWDSAKESIAGMFGSAAGAVPLALAA